MNNGFSLVEVSIVLVILGLMVGGILSGKSLIESAKVNSQLKQIESFKVATRQFTDKYLYLPGDLPNAAQFGFHARQNCRGKGDGDGKLFGLNNINDCNQCAGGQFSQNGEPLLFWQDLSLSKMIPHSFAGIPDNWYNVDGFGYAMKSVFPEAKIGGGAVVVVWSGGYNSYCDRGHDGRNYLAIQAKDNGMWNGGNAKMTLTVLQAYNMDTKIDDTLPQSGAVLAIQSWGQQANWAGVSGQTCCAGWSGAVPPDFNATTTAATPTAPGNCYDNNNITGPQKYSVSNGDATNCVLSFRM